MKELLQYLKKTIDDNADVQTWNAKEALSLQLAGLYEYYRVTVLGESFLLIHPRDVLVIPKVRIHMAKIKEITGQEVALFLEMPSVYSVKKLLTERIAFIVTEKQLYLPFLALHIRQSRNTVEAAEREKFTPAEQLLFLFILYAKKNEFDIAQLSEELGFSSMTILRSMAHLGKIGLVTLYITGKTGRKKVFVVGNRKDYYRIGKSYLINPVKKTIYMNQVPEQEEAYLSGLTALARQTMLSEPANETFAIYGKGDMFLGNAISKEEALAEGYPTVQIMQYDISRIAKDRFVDPVTLILSIKDADDRTEIAIDELMEEFSWYQE